MSAVTKTEAEGGFPTPWPQFSKLYKSIWRHHFAVSGSVWKKFGRQMLNHVEKQQILL